MILMAGGPTKIIISVPRVGGGDPKTIRLYVFESKCSPRRRG